MMRAITCILVLGVALCLLPACGGGSSSDETVPEKVTAAAARAEAEAAITSDNVDAEADKLMKEIQSDLNE